MLVSNPREREAVPAPRAIAGPRQPFHPIFCIRGARPLLLGALLTLALSAPLTAQVSTVLPGHFDGWLIGPFGPEPPNGFVEGPDTPPMGVGSFFTEIVEPASKIILGRNDLHGLTLPDLTALSFWTYIEPTSTNTNNWYLNLYLDADGDGAYETRLDYVPPTAQVMTGVWQFWDALAGTWRVNTSGQNMTLADFSTANPNAIINAFDSPEGLALRFNMGDTSNSYVGFIGNLDGVRIALADVGDITWDFDLTGEPAEIPALSAPMLAILAAFLCLFGFRRLRRKSL